jgi:hypothetical protein
VANRFTVDMKNGIIGAGKPMLSLRDFYST